jgi:hypothetical protein
MLSVVPAIDAEAQYGVIAGPLRFNVETIPGDPEQGVEPVDDTNGFRN